MTIITRVGAIQQMALGRAQNLPTVMVTQATTTGAAAASGFISLGLTTNNIGTSYPGTLVNFPGVPSPANSFRNIWQSNNVSSVKSAWLVILYKIGTVDLTALGNGFTHDTATFPVTRTIYGAANTPVNLVPIIYVTTATTTTAPAFVLETLALGAGYVNQDGSNVIGTKTFTFPNVATAVQSCYILRIEDADSGVRDITQINMTTPTTAGAATIYGMEKICPIITPIAGGTMYDGLLGGFGLKDMTPAIATSGTATSIYAIMTYGSAGATLMGYNVAVRST